jgi:hypothetical protein
MICPYCNKFNDPELILCEYCGRPLNNLSELNRIQTQNLTPRPGTGPLNYPRAGTGFLHNSSFVTLDFVDANRKVYLKTEGHIVLGRPDKEKNWTPSLDLTPFGAAEKGVSRKHVDLFFEADQVFVLELGSANGTRLNGVNVQTGAARPVRHGDLLQLGNLRIRIYFD